MMQEKENARQAWKTERAYVRKHDQMIAREWDHVSSRDWAVLGAVFTACGLAMVLLAGVFA